MRVAEVGWIVPPFTDRRTARDFFKEFCRRSVYLWDIDHRLDQVPRWRPLRHFGNEAWQKTLKRTIYKCKLFHDRTRQFFFGNLWAPDLVWQLLHRSRNCGRWRGAPFRRSLYQVRLITIHQPSYHNHLPLSAPNATFRTKPRKTKIATETCPDRKCLFQTNFAEKSQHFYFFSCSNNRRWAFCGKLLKQKKAAFPWFSRVCKLA